jgi:hypothetical protein
MSIPSDAVQRDETRTSYYWERPDGILVQCIKHGVTQSLADARQNIATFERLAGGQKRPLLVDLRAKFSTEPGVREHYATPESARCCRTMALLIESSFGRIVGNLFMAVNPPPIPMRMFTAEDEAIAWLRRASKGAGRNSA